MATMNQPDATPTRKITAAAIGGSVATVLIFALSFGGVIIPSGLEAALTVLATVGAGYITKENA